MIDLQHIFCLFKCTLTSVISHSFATQTVCVTLVTALFISKVAKYWHRKKCFPPGPSSWPFVGYTRILGPNIWIEMTKMGEQYGPVCSFFLGNRLTVVLNNHHMIREAFVNQGMTFAGRPYPWVMKLVGVKEELNNGDYSIQWAKEKKFVLSALKQFGYSSASLEERVSEEITCLMKVYTQYGRDPFDPRIHLSKTMANLILSILVNQRYAYDDPEFESILLLIHEWQRKVGAANLLDIFPALRFVPRWKPMIDLQEVKDKLVKIYCQFVDEHKRTFEKGVARDVIDVYLQEYGVDCERDKLVGLFFSFVGDAVDSLPEVMIWAVLYLAYHQQCQEDIHAEIQQVVSEAGDVTWGVRGLAPYSEAFIMETLRMSSFVPVTEPHKTLKDCELCGYHIPKGSHVLGNLYAAHMDPLVWEDPQTFRPERFLSQSDAPHPSHLSESRKQLAAFMPYSVGRRMCVGDQLSNKVLFLFVTSLVKSFQVDLVDKEDVPLDAESGYNRKAHSFRVVLSPRRTPTS